MYDIPQASFEVYDVELKGIEKIGESPEDLQRTEKWFSDRKGRFTGSKIKDLMGCSRNTAKLEWGRAEKLVDFSETALKYVYSKAKEIQRNKVIKTAGSYAMSYGTNNESVVVDMLKKQYPDYLFEEVEFLEFIKDIAGASPDRRVITPTKTIGLEVKCSTTWENVYIRHEVPIDQSHDEFWQLQSEMLSLVVNEMMYVVAEPSENIFEPNITDLSIKFVEASPIHQQEMIKRCLIGRKIIDHYLSGLSFRVAVEKGIEDGTRQE